MTFAWPGASHVRNDVAFVDLPNITETSIPHIATIGGDFSLEDLPELQTQDLLDLVKSLGFRMTRLYSLQSFSLNPQYNLQGGEFYIQSVTASSLDSVFIHIRNANDVYVGYVPNVNHLSYNLTRVHKLDIIGNGNLSVMWGVESPLTRWKPAPW